jgi:hypothetical protein
MTRKLCNEIDCKAGEEKMENVFDMEVGIFAVNLIVNQKHIIKMVSVSHMEEDHVALN